MKQYLSSEQTARLIELGFEKPKITFTFKLIEHDDVKTDIDIPVSNYSIGELIEIIDSEVTLGIDKLGARWTVSALILDFTGGELIDCLFDAVVKLKEEGVI